MINANEAIETLYNGTPETIKALVSQAKDVVAAGLPPKTLGYHTGITYTASGQAKRELIMAKTAAGMELMSQPCLGELPVINSLHVANFGQQFDTYYPVWYVAGRGADNLVGFDKDHMKAQMPEVKAIKLETGEEIKEVKAVNTTGEAKHYPLNKHLSL